MPTFYYLAVSNTDNKKMSGQIESGSEDDARRELNKMGLSILDISTQEPDWAKKKANEKNFEFEAIDRTGKKMKGTIDAIDEVAAYERLLGEFQFKVEYLVDESATEEVKNRARENGITLILAEKRRRDEMNPSAKKAFLAAQEQEAEPEEDIFADDETKEDEAQKPKAKLSLSLEGDDPAQNSVTTNSEENLPQEVELEEEGEDISQKNTASEKTEEDSPFKESIAGLDDVQTDAVGGQNFSERLREKIMHHWLPIKRQLFAPTKPNQSFLTSAREAGERAKIFWDAFWGLFGEIVIPPKGKSRDLIWLEMKDLFARKKSQNKVHADLGELIKSVHRPHVYRGIFETIKNFVGMLSGVYLGYFFLALAISRLPISGIFPDFFRRSIENTTLIPFSAFAFLLLYLTFLAQERFVRERVILRGALLFGICLIVIAVSGANLLI